MSVSADSVPRPKTAIHCGSAAAAIPPSMSNAKSRTRAIAASCGRPMALLVRGHARFVAGERGEALMDRKFFVAWVVIFVAWMAGSYVAHGALLHADYEKLAGAFRTPAEAQQYFPFMILAHVIV